MAKNIIKLCEDCDKCPEVEVRQDEFHIKDDYGGYVVLTRDEVNVLLKNFQNL